MEADRHKHIRMHCPVPSLCLVYIDRGGPHKISVSCVGVCGRAVIIDRATDVKPQRLFNCRPDLNNMLEPVSSMSKTTELLNTSRKAKVSSLCIMSSHKSTVVRL